MLATLFGTPRRSSAPVDPTYGGWVPLGASWPRNTLAGSAVSEDLALTHSAVWCATRIITEAVAGLPLHLYRRTDDDGREKAADDPLFDLLDVSPNPDMDSVAFREGRTGHQVNWGQGFAEVERADPRDPESPAVALWPVHPLRVRPTWQVDGVDPAEFPYMVRNDDNSYVPMRRPELLHVPGVFPEDGTWAKGVVAYARESIGGSFAVDRHGYAFFGGGAQPRGVLMVPGMTNPDARKTFRKEWKEVHGSPDSGEIAILPPEGKYVPITLSNEDSQFLETRKFNVTEIARWYRVPAHMVGEFEKAAAYASVEAQGIEFVVYSLMPWLRKWEGQLNLKLLPARRRRAFFIEHNLAGLVRGDLKTRMEAYRVALGGGGAPGFMTVNQVRRLENMSGIGPPGDVVYVPLNVTTADAIAENPPPPGPPAGGRAGAGGDPKGDGAGDPAGNTEGALDAWTRTAAVQLANGRGRRKPRSALIHREPAAGGDVRAAARTVLADVLGRFARKEASAAGRAAKPGGDFGAWADEFYPKHAGLLAAALKPAGELLSALGVAFDATAAAARLCGEARREFAAGYDGDTPNAFAERLARWPAERAAAADDLMGVQT